MTIVIPAYEPTERLVTLVTALRTRFGRIVVVDDGSTSGREYLASVTPLVEKVLAHDRNRGKGAALKTAFAYLGEEDVVTVDADGQHLPEDVAKVAAALAAQREGLVLGVRSFALGRTPFRSLWGGWWTRLAFRVLTGLKLRDTQTGLRGIPAGLLRRVAALPGDGYEYESVMLADARLHKAHPVEIPIETVYLDGNAASHFRPLRDTGRIYAALWRHLTLKNGKDP